MTTLVESCPDLEGCTVRFAIGDDGLKALQG